MAINPASTKIMDACHFDRTSLVCFRLATRPYEGTIIEMAQSLIEQSMV